MSPVASVIVAGSLHYDILVDAPDRPRKGETVTGRSWAPKCGGKGGNQAVAAARHGAPTAMVGAIGDDEFGPPLRARLAAAGVDHSAVKTLAGVGSGMSVAIFDDDGDYGAVIVSGANLSVASAAVSDDVLAQAKVLVLQNEIPEAVNAALAQRAQRHGVTVILNAAPARPFMTDLPRSVDVIVVNATEAEDLGCGAVTSLDAALTAAHKLAATYRSVIVTAGGDGVAAVHDAQSLLLPAIPVDLISTHGAGDAFVGTFAAVLARGGSFSEGLDAANREAARIVSTPERAR